MKHIKVTADALLELVKGVFFASDFEVADEAGTSKVLQLLNMEYYSFKHRIKPAIDWIESIQKSLDRSYCLCELLQCKRTYSADIDHVVIDGRLTVWLQTSKIKLFETFIDECNASCCGVIQEVDIYVENRKELRNMLIEFGAPQVLSLSPASEIGEAATLTVSVRIELAPSICSYNDYTIELSFGENSDAEYLTVPYTSWNYTYNASQVPMPAANNSDSGFVNVSQSNSISLVLYDFNEPLTDNLREIALRCNAIGYVSELNKPIYLRITIKDTGTYIYKVLPKTITLNSENTTFNTIAAVFAPEGGL